MICIDAMDVDLLPADSLESFQPQRKVFKNVIMVRTFREEFHAATIIIVLNAFRTLRPSVRLRKLTMNACTKPLKNSTLFFLISHRVLLYELTVDCSIKYLAFSTITIISTIGGIHLRFTV